MNPEKGDEVQPEVTLRIGIIGGGELCREILGKSFRNYRTKYVQGEFVAVADPDPEAPGLVLAREMGLYTTADYHDFYRPELDINQIFVFTPEDSVLQDLLKTRPRHIRFLAYNTARMFLDIIRSDERRIKARRDELAAIVNGIRDGIAVLDREYKIVQVNRALVEELGLTREEVLGRKCHEVFHHSVKPCQPPEHPCPIRTALQTGRPAQAIHHHLTLEGEERIIDLVLYPIRDEAEQVSHFIEISRDITEREREQAQMRRALEEAVAERTRQLEETYAKMLQQDKMSSLGKLSASVVHELNNPLSGILTFVRLIQRLLREKGVAPEVIQMIQGHLAMMETETNRCSQIVSNLLAFARQSKLEPEETDLNQVLDHIIALNDHFLSLRNIEVVKDYQPALPPVYCDVNRLQQIFMNLIFNAGEAIAEEEPGRLIVSTRHAPEEDMLLTRITDSGSGIAPAHLPHIFEPFFTTKLEGRKVGLGLSVAYGIVKEHRGQIEVEETGSEGTTFLVKLPVYHPEKAAAGADLRETG